MDLNFNHNLKKAVRQQCKGNDDAALRRFKTAERRKPNHPIVNMGLGTTYMNKGMYGHAERCFRAVTAKTEKLPEPYINLCYVLKKMGYQEQGLTYAQMGLDIHPDNVLLLVNAGSAAYTCGHMEVAEQYLKKAIALDPENIDAHWDLGLVFLRQGRFQEGWEHYDWGFRSRERIPRPYWDEFPEWLGDCHPRLEKIFRRSFPEVTVIPARKDRETSWTKFHEIDYQVPIGSLGGFFRNKITDFPDKGYIRTTQSRVEEYKKEIGGKLRVGLSWRGGAPANGAYHRAHTVSDFTDFLTGNGAQFVCLQYGDVGEELQDVRTNYGVEVYHNPAALEDYDETLHLAASCDLVISTITAIVYTAGSIDVPTWVLVPKYPNWKFIPGEKMPWHPSIKQYHQSQWFVWDDVYQKVGADLRDFING